MDVSTLKIILLVVMFFLTLAFALLPIKVYRMLNDPRRANLIPKSSFKSWPSFIISLLTCFAGGVFIAIVFLDLLPDAEEAFENVKNSNEWNVDYPVVQLIALLGFFLVYAVEETTTRLFHGDGHVHAHDQTLVTAHNAIFDVEGRASRSGSGGSAECEIHGRHAPVSQNEQELQNSTRVVQSVVFTLALVIHCAFEGFAFGVQPDQISILSLFFGIIVHKSVVAFSVGLRLIRCHPQRLRLVIALVLVFVLTSPLFGGLGMAIEESKMDQLTKDKVATVLTSASLGTFLYIAFFEMLAPERDNKHSSLAKMIATFVGFAVIAGVMAFGH